MNANRNGKSSRAAFNALKIDGSYMNEDNLRDQDDGERANGDDHDEQYHTVDYDDVTAANMPNNTNASASVSKGWFSNLLANTRRSSKKSIGNHSQYLNGAEKSNGDYGDRLM